MSYTGGTETISIVLPNIDGVGRKNANQLGQRLAEAWLYYFLLSSFASPVTSSYKLSTWQNPMIFSDIRVHVRDVVVFDIRVFSDDIFHVLPFGERSVYEGIVDGLHSGGIFVDAGANIGFYTVLAARIVGPKGRVIPVEKIPETAKILKWHIALNNIHHICTVVDKALSELPNKIVVARYTNQLAGQSSIMPGVVNGNSWLSARTGQQW